ncbi:MAG: VCBS repeat-containing protein, partial [Armatimonadota bacterium]|nr:VCBS repeat-containing protein [Armatimonadota bacterium]
IAVGDIDGDGQNEIVLSEGDACIYGYPDGGKLGWFKPCGDIRELWEEHRLENHLLDPHSLQLGDLCGNQRLDILVGEIGVWDKLEENPPRLFIYENDGGGGFTRHLIDQGIGTHHARLADFRGRGVLDIASRPLHGPDKWKIFVWENESAFQGECEA